MADKKINELSASSGLTDDALLPVYQNDQTQSITGALLKSFAQQAVQKYTDAAAASAQQADGSASSSAESAKQAADSLSQLGNEVELAQSAREAAETAQHAAEAAQGAVDTLAKEAAVSAQQAE